MAADSVMWVTRTDAAALVSLSSRQFDEVIRPKLPADATKGKGAALRFNAAMVVTAIIAYRLEKAQPKSIDGDPFMAGVDSPALERYRKARAELVEMDVQQRRKDVVRRSALLDAISPAIAAMRDAGRKLALDYGKEAGETYNEAVGEFESVLIDGLKRFDAADAIDPEG
ncbi:MAG TPA: hypothetical protein VGN72_10130 [Tepidisphaeraceae bacterium]|jgi:hypothetical protein|nr:hypothetical protein [Tepidisphaeraceae bacterium]